MHRHTRKPLIGAAFVAMACMTGCNRPQAAPPTPVPEVAVVTVKLEHVVRTSELPGRTCGHLVAEIRPQVNGLLQKRLFTEGSQVKAGQILYQIDPAPYQAALDSASANLLATRKAADRARASLDASTANLKAYQATLTLAKTNFERQDSLHKVSAISATEHDQGVRDMRVAEAVLRNGEAQVESDRESLGMAEAAIKQAEAALETARINLNYTTITAPISGRIGRSDITEGAIVTAYQPVALATIQQFDPIYVDVRQPTRDLNQLKRLLANGRLKNNGSDSVKIVLEDGTEYPQVGSLQFRDVTVDPTTGSVILRIVVPNPDGILLPGMFVGAVIDEGVNEQAILIPQQAVSRDAKDNPNALVVNAEGKVEPRRLTVDRALGNTWLVSSGLAPGDRVIVEGMQKARPGTAVSAVPFQAGAPSAAKKAESTAQATTTSK
jgi:membrane fusion protein, multidrug efflux system